MVRGLTGRARDSIEARFTDTKGKLDLGRSGDFRAAYVSLAIVDADGALLFADATSRPWARSPASRSSASSTSPSASAPSGQEDVDGITAT